ncbi:MAG: archease [Nitrososphaerales archaeon]
MPYKYIEDLSIADVAFEAYGESLEELFLSCALAITNTMIKDLSKVEPIFLRNIVLENDDIEMLLFNFLQELIFYKDAEKLLFSSLKIKLKKVNTNYKLECEARGEELNMAKHELLVDVKAVTLHHFQVKLSEGRWMAKVVLDV